MRWDYQKFKEWRLRNKDRVLAWNLEYRTRWRRKVLDHMGARCVVCGFSDIRALQIDHVNGSGRVDRSSVPSTQAFYKKVIHDKSNQYQLLCANCNQIKRLQNKEHRTKRI